MIMIREAGLANYVTKLYRKLRPKHSPYTVLNYTCQHLPAQATHGPVGGDYVMSPSLLGVAVTSEGERKAVRARENLCKIRTHK
jgi:hypothetical protein